VELLAGRFPARGACAVARGAFDGVHRGHVAVLRRLRAVADARRLSVVVVLQPSAAQRGAMARCLLTDPAQRDALLLCHGADAVVADIEGLSIAVEVAGADDSARRGLERVPTQTHAELAISSTRTRLALGEADLTLVTSLLGRPFSLAGSVTEGRRLGATLGAATANIALDGRPLPLSGVFAAQALGLGAPRPAMAYIGTRPTVAARGERSAAVLEVHILDFAGDLYGRRLEVALLQRVRDEERLPSLEALQQGIADNVARVRRFFGSRRFP
jgi:riboflavin kinase / FMN adenylyltransferase